MRQNNKSQSGRVPPVPQARCSRETLLAVAVLVVAGFLAYASSFSGKFIFDDNRFIKVLRASQPQEFLSAPESLARPLVSLSLAANYVISGLEVWSYHAFNLAVHLLAALVLFGIVRLSLQSAALKERFGRDSGRLALAVALLWLLHPLQTESVTYIWQRSESLAGLFFLVTLYCVIRCANAEQGLATCQDTGNLKPPPERMRLRVMAATAARWPRSRIFWHILAAAACAAGMACKATMVTAPVVIFAYDCIFLAGSAGVALRKRWGLYGALAATWALLAIFISAAPPGAQVDFTMQSLPAAVYARTELGVILYYLSLSFHPAGLCLDYMWPAAQQVEEFMPGAIVVGALIIAAIWAWGRNPAWSFLGIWFFAILAPTSSFFPFFQDLAAEHRMYLPLAAVAVFTVMAAYLLGEAVLRRIVMSPSLRNTVGKSAAAVLLIATAWHLGYLTYQRNVEYHNPYDIWNGVIKVRPDNWRAYNEAGIELNLQGKRDKAIESFTKAVKLNPKDLEAFVNRGNTHRENNDLDGALADFDKALELNPGLAALYDLRGGAYEAKGDVDKALADRSKAIELDPQDVEAHLARGNLRLNKDELGAALMDFKKAVELNPRLEEAYNCLAHAYMKQGNYSEAQANCDKALQLNPRFAEAYNNRSIVCAKKGDLYGAVADCAKAIALDPSNWQAWIRKGLSLVKLGRQQEAQACFDEGLKINPDIKNTLPEMISRALAERRKQSEREGDQNP